MKLRIILLPILFVFLSLPVSAAEPEDYIPAERLDAFRLGYAAFTGGELDSESNYLLTSIPRRMAERMKTIGVHVLEQDEVRAYRDEILTRGIKNAAEKINSFRKERDRLLFSPNSPEAYTEKYDELSRSIREMKDLLDKLETYPAEEIPVPRELPLIHNTRSGEMLPPVFQELPDDDGYLPVLSSYARENKLQALLWGVLRKVRDYLILEIHYYNDLTGEDRIVLRDAGDSGDIPAIVNTAAGETAEIILGRTWGTLTVRPSVDSAEVKVNGRLAGYGDTRVSFIEPGPAEIKVTAPGFKDYSRTVEIGTDQETVIEPELTPAARKTVTVQSGVPADLYLKSQPLGALPQDLSLPPETVPGRVVQGGFKDSIFVLTPDIEDGANLTVPLDPTFLDPEEEFKRSRKLFYRSFGFFVLSVPIPLALNGVYQNYAMGYYQTEEGTEERRRFANLGNGLYYSYLGGIFISGVLLVNTVLKLINFIDTASEFHSRVHHF
ncbi:MAG: PEGA domain-containing protein [Spirochaetia bacterium]